MPADHLLRQAQLAADLAHLVLEQLAQRLEQLERQPLGQPAHVVVGLDRDRRPAPGRERLDHVGIQRALHQEPDVLPDRLRLRLEDVDERVADPAPLLLRIGDARPAARGSVARASTTRRSMPRCRRKVVSTCSRSCSRSRPWSTKMQVSRSPTARCTSTAATEESTPPESPQITRLVGPTSSRIRATSVSTKCPGVQSGAAAADLEQEVVEDLAAPRRVRHLGMELDAEERPLGRARSPRSASWRSTRSPGSPAAATSTWSPWLIQTGVSSPAAEPAGTAARPRP